MPEKVIIIGSGPAGLTAAIYTARANLDPVCFTGQLPGGQLMTTTEVENYPGFPEGRMGPQLMDDFRKQAERFGAKMIDNIVEKVDLSERPFKVWAMGDSEPRLAESVIISTGAEARTLKLDNEARLMGRGLSTCATCDGAFFRDKVIAVMGGDSAMEEANFLTRFGTKVYLIHRRREFRASKIMQERALANEKIEVLYNKVITEYLHEGNKLTGARLKDVETDEQSDLPLDGLFLAIGHTPLTDLFKGQLDLDDQGYLLVKPGTSRTNIEGVFACGDCQDHVYRQAITAAGTGCMAAIDAERFLAEFE